MAKIRISVHPLCFFFALYYVVAGNFLVFFIYTLCALLHEIGHSLVSEIKGYRLDKICLMPYGAVIFGDLSDMTFFDEIIIALAGPMLNLFIALFFVALWWIFPLTYAFTDIVVEANVSLCVVNLLPLPSLDGGRIINAITVRKLGERLSQKLNIVVGIIGGAVFILLFVLSCFKSVNISYLLFASFLFISLFDNKNKGRYIKIYLSVSERKLKRGLTVVRTAISGDVPLKKLFSLLKTDCINEVDVYIGGKAEYRLSNQNISELLLYGDREKSVKYNLMGKNVAKNY